MLKYVVILRNAKTNLTSDFENTYYNTHMDPMTIIGVLEVMRIVNDSVSVLSSTVPAPNVGTLGA